MVLASSPCRLRISRLSGGADDRLKLSDRRLYAILIDEGETAKHGDSGMNTPQLLSQHFIAAAAQKQRIELRFDRFAAIDIPPAILLVEPISELQQSSTVLRFRILGE